MRLNQACIPLSPEAHDYENPICIARMRRAGPCRPGAAVRSGGNPSPLNAVILPPGGTEGAPRRRGSQRQRDREAERPRLFLRLVLRPAQAGRPGRRQDIPPVCPRLRHHRQEKRRQGLRPHEQPRGRQCLGGERAPQRSAGLHGEGRREGSSKGRGARVLRHPRPRERRGPRGFRFPAGRRYRVRGGEPAGLRVFPQQWGS